MATTNPDANALTKHERAPIVYHADTAALAGLLSGLLAGALLAILLVIQGVALGVGPWTALRAVGATFLGRHAMGSQFEATSVLVGVAAHFGLSLAFGLVFGLLAYSLSRALVLWSGLVFGLLVYAFMAFVALPVANPSMVPGEISFRSAGLHALFGLAIALYYEPLRYALLSPRRARRRPVHETSTTVITGRRQPV